MCFSAQASFTVGAALVPAGAYCLRQGLRLDRRFLGFAAMPLLFGVQQLCEGVVWLGLDGADPDLVQAGALAFLFFALAWWPVWVPLSVALVEPVRSRRRAMLACGALGLAWAVVLYLPIAWAPERWLHTEVRHHSIGYDYPDLPVYGLIPRPWLRLLYFGTIAVPLALASVRRWAVFGYLLGGSALVSHLVFARAFVSVWCFFAAVLSLGLCYLFATLPRHEPSAPPSPG